jgi:hypothetical protein
MFLVLAAAGPAVAAVPSQLEVNARARAEGNRPGEAIALATTVLPLGGPLQILKVRVDAVGAHAVAGITLEGRSKHLVSRAALRDQVVALARTALSGGALEEVDIWAIVPIPVAKGAIVSGPMAVPTSKTVFAATFRRGDEPPAEKMRRGRGVYVDPEWSAGLAP